MYCYIMKIFGKQILFVNIQVEHYYREVALHVYKQSLFVKFSPDITVQYCTLYVRFLKVCWYVLFKLLITIVLEIY
jgi:hypothetical protein